MSTVSAKPLIEAGFGLKGLKKWNTRDGGGYQFILTFGGKPVAEVTNDGHGGPTDIRWVGLRWSGEVALPADATPAQRKAAALAAEAHEKMAEIVKAIPPVESYGTTLTVNDEWLMEEMVNHTELERVCKKKTAFRLPEDGDHSYRVLNTPYSSDTRAYILGRWPAAVILNESVAA